MAEAASVDPAVPTNTSLSTGPSQFDIGFRNGKIEGLNAGMEAAAQKFEVLILSLFGSFVVQLAVSALRRWDVTIPVCEKLLSDHGGTERFYTFLEDASWTAGLFFATLLAYTTQFPFLAVT